MTHCIKNYWHLSSLWLYLCNVATIQQRKKKNILKKCNWGKQVLSNAELMIVNFTSIEYEKLKLSLLAKFHLVSFTLSMTLSFRSNHQYQFVSAKMRMIAQTDSSGTAVIIGEQDLQTASWGTALLNHSTLRTSHNQSSHFACCEKDSSSIDRARSDIKMMAHVRNLEQWGNPLGVQTNLTLVFCDVVKGMKNVLLNHTLFLCISQNFERSVISQQNRY